MSWLLLALSMIGGVAASCGGSEDGTQPGAGGGAAGSADSKDGGGAGSDAAGGGGMSAAGGSGGLGGRDASTDRSVASDGSPDGSAGDASTTSDATLDASDDVVLPPPSSVSYKSGTRLQALVWVSEGGVKLFRRWKDTQLGIDCEITLASDGTLRCLPWTGLAEPWYVYSDAACTQAAATKKACSLDLSWPLPSYVARERPGPSCDDVFGRMHDAYRVEAETTGTTYSLDSQQQCTSSSGGLLYPLTLIPPSSFVQFQIVDTPVGDGMAVRTAVATDGAEQRVAMVRASTGERCEAEQFPDGTLRCVDAYRADDSGHEFSSDQCTGPTVARDWHDDACPKPNVVVRDTSYEPCGDVIDSVHAVGNLLDPSTVYDDQNACSSSSGYGRYYSIGSELPEADYPALTRVYLGSGRLKVEFLATAAGVPLLRARYSHYWDSAEQRRCRPYTAPDGLVRCINLNLLGYGNRFGDSECTSTPVVSLFGWCPLRPPELGGDGAAKCTQLEAEHVQPLDTLRALSPYTGSTVYYVSYLTEACEGPVPAGSDEFQVGASVSPTDFVALTESVE